jgi:hypothetical protein
MEEWPTTVSVWLGLELSKSKKFSFLRQVHTGCGVQYVLYRMGIKLPKSEVYILDLFSANVENLWMYTSTLSYIVTACRLYAWKFSYTDFDDCVIAVEVPVYVQEEGGYQTTSVQGRVADKVPFEWVPSRFRARMMAISSYTSQAVLACDHTLAHSSATWQRRDSSRFVIRISLITGSLINARSKIDSEDAGDGQKRKFICITYPYCLFCYNEMSYKNSINVNQGLYLSPAFSVLRLLPLSVSQTST